MGSGTTPDHLGFVAMALVASLLWGTAPILGKLGLRIADPATALLVRTMGVAVIMVSWGAFSGGFARAAALGWRPVVFLLGEGILASLLGHFAYLYALKFSEAGRVVPIAATYPLFTAAIAALFLGEALTWQKGLGALLVVAGVWLLKG